MVHSPADEASKSAIRSGIACAASLALFATFMACTRQDVPSKAATGTAPASAAAPVEATSPASTRADGAKPASAEECRKTCNGEWSAHGITGVVSCLCRTNDSGEDCRDKSDCQGDCLLADPVRTEKVSDGPPARGYFIGKCAEFVTTFGCVRRIQPGAKTAGPVDLSEPPPAICLD